MGSIAHELITRGRGKGRSLKSDGTVCLIGAAAAAHGQLSDNFLHCWWSLTPTVQQALYSACPDAERYAAQFERGMDLAVPLAMTVDGMSDDAALRVAKIADEILDAS